MGLNAQFAASRVNEPYAHRLALSRRALLSCLPAAALIGCGEPGVTRVPVREAGLVGTLFLPPNPERQAAVVSLTGAGGGLWEAPAQALAEAGFATLALATHNYPGLPSKLRLIPLDTVEKAVTWLRDRVRPKNGCVALRGWSRGGELALLLASLTPTVNAVLAYSPRCYVAREHGKPNNFNDPTAAAAWTYRGATLAGQPLPSAMLEDPARQSLEDLYGIAVERIAGPIMLVSGQADTGIVGTSAAVGCDRAMRRLDLFHFAHSHVHHSYPDAGHNIAGPPPFEGPVQDGGTLAGDAAAVADSWPRSLTFLKAAAA
jgi:dienelactone hydrolase